MLRNLKERTNQEWLADLRLPPPGRDTAIEDLRSRLVSGLRRAFYGREEAGGGVLEDVAQEALLRILRQLDTFRGESRFLTWATKIAVSLALTEFRRRRWRDVSWDGFPDAENLFPSRAVGPEQNMVRRELMDILRRTIQHELPEKQRRAILAVRFHDMPLDEVARRMHTNRNAVYKLLFDARRTLKKVLLRKGLTVQEILDAFR